MKNQKNNLNNSISQGLRRIEEIKSNISALSRRRLAKAEVYEMWENIFDTEE